MEIQFEWDERKSRLNLRKHGISFEEAHTVFFDENGRFLDDPDHSESEERFVLIGLSHGLRVLTVVHCYRESEEVIRLISARKATAKEIRQYEEHL